MSLDVEDLEGCTVSYSVTAATLDLGKRYRIIQVFWNNFVH